MTRNTLIVALVVLGTLLVAGVALSQGHHAMGRGNGMGMNADVPEALRLSDDQLQQIEQIHDRHAAEFTAIHGQVRDLNAAIDNELAKDQPDRTKLADLRNERTALIAQANELRDKQHNEVNAVLTPEQRAFFGERGRMHNGMGMGMGCAMGDGCPCMGMGYGR